VSEQPSTAIQPFVHLSVHTEFSLVDSTVRIKPFAKQVAQSMAAAAVTDRDNLFALVKYYRAASAAGIKPIAGVDLRVRGMAQDDELTRVILLVQNNTGYLNLTNLVSRGYQEGQSTGTPVVNSDWIFDAHEGLIVLSGALEGDVGKAILRGHQDEALDIARRWQAVFGDRYYLELNRTGNPSDRKALGRALYCGCLCHRGANRLGGGCNQRCTFSWRR